MYMYMYIVHCMYMYNTGDMSIEELLKLYKLERDNVTPESNQEEEETTSGNKKDESRDSEDDKEEEDEEDDEIEEEPGLELLVSGKTVQEVSFILARNCTLLFYILMLP